MAAKRQLASEPVAAVVLAAGCSSRFGSPKTRVPVAGTAMFERVVHALLDAGLRPVIVVVGPASAEASSWPTGEHVSVVHNHRASEGIGTSVAAGISHCPHNAPAAVVALADQPGLTPELVGRLIAAWRDGHGTIIRPSWRGAPRHPVVFDRALFPELVALDADHGGSSVIAQHADDLYEINVEDERLVADIDTTDDLSRFETL